MEKRNSSKRALEPLAEGSSARRRYDHEKVDLEAARPDRVPRLADGEPPAEEVGPDEEHERHPLGDIGERAEHPA